MAKLRPQKFRDLPRVRELQYPTSTLPTFLPGSEPLLSDSETLRLLQSWYPCYISALLLGKRELTTVARFSEGMNVRIF